MLLSKLFRNNFIKVSMNMTEGKIHFITWLVSMYGPSAGLRLSTGFSHVAALGYIRGFRLYSRLWVIFEVLGYIRGFGLYLGLWVIFEHLGYIRDINGLYLRLWVIFELSVI